MSKLFVTFQEYTEFGYDAIPELRFARFMIKAGGFVEKWTLGRVNYVVLNPANNEYVDDELIERNKRGICEIAELVFTRDNPAIGESGQPIKSFSNEGYSETLANAGTAEMDAFFECEAMGILTAYFTPEQLYRGGGG